MKWLIRCFDFYLDASIHVAWATVSFLQITAIVLAITINCHLYFALFFGTVACYNFIKYGVEAEKYLLVSGKYLMWIQGISIFSLLVALYHFCFLPPAVWFGFGLLILLTALYALPVLPKAKNFRSFGGFKTFIVAIVWSLATVTIPLLTTDSILNLDAGIELIQRFILVVVLLLPFEIRDLEFDPPTLRTIPQRIGIKRTKLLGVGMAVCFFLLTFFKNHITPEEMGSKAAIFFLSLVVLWVTKKKQSKYFASFWVESVPLIWWAIVWVTAIYG